MTAQELEIIRAIQKSGRMADTPKGQIEKMALIERLLKEKK